eukprot:3144200-Amphidinium_carterae.1
MALNGAILQLQRSLGALPKPPAELADAENGTAAAMEVIVRSAQALALCAQPIPGPSAAPGTPSGGAESGRFGGQTDVAPLNRPPPIKRLNPDATPWEYPEADDSGRGDAQEIDADMN